MSIIQKIVSDSRGITHLVAILGVIVIAVVGSAGYYVMTQPKNTAEKANDQASSATFESKSDLEQASKTLDDGHSDADIDPAQLDTDLNELL